MGELGTKSVNPRANTLVLLGMSSNFGEDFSEEEEEEEEGSAVIRGRDAGFCCGGGGCS